MIGSLVSDPSLVNNQPQSVNNKHLAMSPPKVSLTGKDCVKPIFEEILPEKNNGEDLPAVINVETERRARNLRRLRKQQKCRRIVCGVLIVIGVAVAALATMLLVLHFRPHRKSWDCRRKGLPENVKVDPENQLIYAKHDSDENSKTNAREVLHEYDRGLIAYKDIEGNKCYIDRLDETFEEGYERWQLYEKTDRNDTVVLKVISAPIELEVIKRIGDVHITAHCENAESVWVMEIDLQEVTTEMKVVYI